MILSKACTQPLEYPQLLMMLCESFSDSSSRETSLMGHPHHSSCDPDPPLLPWSGTKPEGFCHILHAFSVPGNFLEGLFQPAVMKDLL